MQDQTKGILRKFGVHNEAKWMTLEPGFEVQLRPMQARAFQREIRKCAAERGTDTDEKMYLNEVEAWLAVCFENWRVVMDDDSIATDPTPEDALGLFSHPDMEMHYTLARERTVQWYRFREERAGEEGKDSPKRSRGRRAGAEST